MRFVLLMAAMTIAALTLSAADLAGTWKGAMETQGGPTDVALTFTTGSTPAGTALLGEFRGAIEKGTMKGDRIHFEVTIEHGTVVFDGTVAGDEIKFNVIGTQGSTYTLVSKRVSASAK